MSTYNSSRVLTIGSVNAVFHRAVLVLIIGSAMVSTTKAEPGARILATSGATSIEGAAGGGIVPWALISGYSETGQFGGSAALTSVNLPDFSLRSLSAGVGIGNRLEVSVTSHNLDLDSVPSSEPLGQSAIGLKYRIVGDLIYTAIPQVSLGVQYKRHFDFALPEQIGAQSDSGTDVYIAGSKLWLDGLFHRTTFANVTVRATKANQIGLLGFGGDKQDSHTFVAETSVGIFLNRQWVVGMEYRQKPDNLSNVREDDWSDVFVGWFPNKRVSLIAAWARLGSIAGFEEQDSVYISLQLTQ